MKKPLMLLGSIGLTATAGLSAVACNSKNEKKITMTFDDEIFKPPFGKTINDKNNIEKILHLKNKTELYNETKIKAFNELEIESIKLGYNDSSEWNVADKSGYYKFMLNNQSWNEYNILEYIISWGIEKYLINVLSNTTNIQQEKDVLTWGLNEWKNSASTNDDANNKATEWYNWAISDQWLAK